MPNLRPLFIILLVALSACNSPNKKTIHNSDSNKSTRSESEHIANSSQQHEKTSEQREKERKQNIADSINTLLTLELGLNIAEEHKHDSHFEHESDSLKIRFGNLFSPSKKHLIINRIFNHGVNADIYKLQGEKFTKVCSKEMAYFAFIGDTIQDVNGDGRRDYLFHWYPMSGCCIRDVFDVFLQKSNGNFAEEVEFINPSFSPKEKMIRGRRYGYNAPLYKYKWNGYEVDTIEFIYFIDSTNQIIKRKHEDENEKGINLDHLPNEYKKIGYNFGE